MKIHLLLLSIYIYCLPANGQDIHLPKSRPGVVGFTENRGQVTDQYGCAREDLDFVVKTSNGLSVFIGVGRISYQFSRAISGCESERLQDMYRLDVMLVGANPHARVITEAELASYERYHTATINTNERPAHAFGRVTYKDVWPGIDWVLYGKEGHIEYDFIVHPGSDPSVIRIEYGGATELVKDGDKITAKTPLGSITERNLHCYIRENNQRLASGFVLNGNSVAFDVERQPGTLVIDPTLEWSTYFGGTSNEGYGRITTKDGYLYMLGFGSSVSGIATTGSYQSTHGGGQNDIYFCKFTSGGSLIWATYYGGSGGDGTMSHIVADDSGNVYISGSTNSTDSIATVGACQPALAGSDDAFLAKFSAAGTLLWSTYFGGSGREVGSDVALDGNGAIYICGSTASTSGIATPGAFHTSNAGGPSDGFLARFTTGGNLVWATYFGGSNVDPAYRVICDKMSNVYISGSTNSTDNIATPGAHNTAWGGVGNDAYLAKFHSSGSLLWSTYYGGDKNEDGQGGMVCDSVGNVYISGGTSSTDSIATVGAHQEALGGVNDAYIAKFNPIGVLLWGTYYGGGGPDESWDLFLTKGGKIYSTGEAGSVDSIATSGAYKAYRSVGADAYIATFSADGLLKYGTYFGGSNGDYGFGVTVDDSGNVYLAGQTRSVDSIATPDAHQTVYGGGMYDMFLAKFRTDSIFAPVDTTLAGDLLSSGANVRVYPNPVRATLQIQCSCVLQKIVIYDVFGRLLNETSLVANNDRISVDVAGLSPGIYLYKLYNSQGTIKAGKFLKE